MARTAQLTQTIVAELLPSSVVRQKTLMPYTDLSTVKEGGIYFVNVGKGLPATPVIYNYGMLIVFQNSNIITQIYIPHLIDSATQSYILFRDFHNSAWTKWSYFQRSGQAEAQAAEAGS